MITFKDKKEEEFWKQAILAKFADVTHTSSLGIYSVGIGTSFADEVLESLRERQKKDE